jgi:hypothetical protein
MTLQSRTRGLACALLGVVAVCLAETPDSAVSQFQLIRQQLHDSHARDDWQTNLRYARSLRELLNGAPGSQLEVARAELQLGETEAGLGSLAVFARMGQTIDPVQIFPNIASLPDQEVLRNLQQTFEANRREISRASTAFVLADPALLAEDIDYDSHSQRFFISSVRLGKIVTADLHGATRDFARAPDGWPMLALKVDARRGRLWATEVALQGLGFAPKADWGRSGLLCFALKGGKLLRRVEGPKGSALGDMLVTPQGEVIVSDGDGGGLYRLREGASALERLDAGDFISPQTAAPHPDGKHLFVPDYLRGIGVLDPTSRQVEWLPMNGQYALNGIDGLYASRGALVAVQNGTSPERVVIFRLNDSLSGIASEVIIERASQTLGDPTHGVIVGTTFYYIANSGWDVIDEHGALKPGAQLSPARVMRVELQNLRR